MQIGEPLAASLGQGSTPLVELVSPAEGAVARSAPLTFRASDDLGLVSVLAFVTTSGRSETIHDGDAFSSKFEDESARTDTEDAGGNITQVDLSLVRRGGWPPGDFTVKVRAWDSSGLESSETFSFSGIAGQSHIEAIRDVLVADAPLAALVGTRVYPEVAPQGCARPFLVVTEISDIPQNGLTTTLATALRNVTVQVDSYAETKAGAIALSQAVEDALDVSGPDLSITLENSTTLYEDQTKLRRVSADYSVWRGR